MEITLQQLRELLESRRECATTETTTDHIRKSSRIWISLKTNMRRKSEAFLTGQDTTWKVWLSISILCAKSKMKSRLSDG